MPKTSTSAAKKINSSGNSGSSTLDLPIVEQASKFPSYWPSNKSLNIGTINIDYTKLPMKFETLFTLDTFPSNFIFHSCCVVGLDSVDLAHELIIYVATPASFTSADPDLTTLTSFNIYPFHAITRNTEDAPISGLNVGDMSLYMQLKHIDDIKTDHDSGLPTKGRVTLAVIGFYVEPWR